MQRFSAKHILAVISHLTVPASPPVKGSNSPRRLWAGFNIIGQELRNILKIEPSIL